MAEVRGHVWGSKLCVSVWGRGCVWVAAALRWHQAALYAWVMDTSACSISLPTNQPYMILHLQMQNTPIMDAVIKWCFNLACLWLERKQPIHLTNEVISAAIGWPCRFTYGHYTVAYVKHYQSSAGLVMREAENPNGLNEYQIHHIQTAWPVPKSVKIRHAKEKVVAVLYSLSFLGITLNLTPSFRLLCQCRKQNLI